MRRPLDQQASGGFTLVELLVATAITSLLVVLLVAVINQTNATWHYTTGRIEQFREARDAFESMTRKLGQATLNTYLDYVDTSGNARSPSAATAFVPARYARQSELRFLSGNGVAGTASTTPPRPTHSVFFVAPLGFVSRGAATQNQVGLETLLNTWGYYVEFNRDDPNARPSFVTDQIQPPRYRFRLMELMQSSEQMSIYKYTANHSGQYPNYVGHEWFTDALNSTPVPVHVLAGNVVALVLWPKLAPSDERALISQGTLSGPLGTNLAPDYGYDSTTAKATADINPKCQLPPTLQVTMVAVDEVSYNRFQHGTTMPDLGLNNLFKDSTKYDADLKTFLATLLSNKLDARVFTTETSIKAAKWSRDQSN